MKLVLLIGDSAVGKMTVGQELEKITDLRLFHNHMTIEPVIQVFGAYEPKVVARLREVFFEEFASTDNYGMIFTFMWAFDQAADWDYIDHVTGLFKARGASVYYVELIASQAVRLQRNRTANRLHMKASKRDVEASQRRLLADDIKYRCVSAPGELTFDNYLRLENERISARECAERIKAEFGL